jgi:hypothetical protein
MLRAMSERATSELGPSPLPGPFPAFAVRAVLALRARLRAALDASGPAELAIAERITSATQTIMLGEVARLGIADLLEARGPLSAAQIAEATSLDPDPVFRMMRALALGGVFARRRDGRFENNRLSSVLGRGDRSRLRDFAVYFASRSNIAAWHALGETLRDGKEGFARANGRDVWSYFDAHPEERETFAHAMMGLTTAEAPEIATLYPFSEVGTVCDVGGGRGTLLSEILIRHPHLRGVLCDAPGVLESARSLLRARGVEQRVELAPGSFFDAVPSGADAYLLKNVLHDWDDARSITILEVCRRAARRGAKLLVCEALVEPDTDDVIGAFSDVQMMVVCGGRERGRRELTALLERSGYVLGRVFPGGTISVIESIAA